MATLTASGVNCSNGTLDGYYTGTASNNTSFPIGSYLFAARDYCPGFLYNNKTSTVKVANDANSTQFYWTDTRDALFLAGTWRSRGCANSNYIYNLMQRVA